MLVRACLDRFAQRGFARENRTNRGGHHCCGTAICHKNCVMFHRPGCKLIGRQSVEINIVGKCANEGADGPAGQNDMGMLTLSLLGLGRYKAM